ncbi:PqqD family protein [Rhodovibrionaceae bacterium A322]
MALQRNPNVTASEIEGEYFLVEPLSNEIFYLDAVSGGLWRLLEQEQGAEDIIATLQAAFPDQPAETVAADVKKLIADMLAAELIREAT